MVQVHLGNPHAARSIELRIHFWRKAVESPRHLEIDVYRRLTIREYVCNTNIVIRCY